MSRRDQDRQKNWCTTEGLTLHKCPFQPFAVEPAARGIFWDFLLELSLSLFKTWGMGVGVRVGGQGELRKNKKLPWYGRHE